LKQLEVSLERALRHQPRLQNPFEGSPSRLRASDLVLPRSGHGKVPTRRWPRAGADRRFASSSGLLAVSGCETKRLSTSTPSSAHRTGSKRMSASIKAACRRVLALRRFTCKVWSSAAGSGHVILDKRAPARESRRGRPSARRSEASDGITTDGDQNVPAAKRMIAPLPWVLSICDIALRANFSFSFVCHTSWRKVRIGPLRGRMHGFCFCAGK